MLNSNEVRPNERNVVLIAEHSDDSAVVNSRNEDGEEVREESRLFLEIECEGLNETLASKAD